MGKREAENKELYKNLIGRGYVEINSTLYSPAQVVKLIESGVYVPIDKKKTLKSPKNASNIRTGWIDDYLNIRNKENKTDMFIKLIEQELKVKVWPEFFFLADRRLPFDWAIPVSLDNKPIKIAIEQDGGIWMKGGGAHSRPQNIERDIQKSTLANVNGWTLIRRTPDQLITNETIDLIKKAIELKNK